MGKQQEDKCKEDEVVFEIKKEPDFENEVILNNLDYPDKIKQEEQCEIEVNIDPNQSKNAPDKKAPLCPVCETKPLEINYSCKKCRRFFQRAYLTRHILICIGRDNKCKIGRNNFRCRKCRYLKCLRVGMRICKRKKLIQQQQTRALKIFTIIHRILYKFYLANFYFY